MLPKSITIRNFRSIGDRGFELTNLNKINIIIGRNNSGKSNVIRAISSIRKMIGSIAGNPYKKLEKLDHYNADESKTFSFDIEIQLPEVPLVNHVAKSLNINTVKFSFDATDTELKMRSSTFTVADESIPQNQSNLKIALQKEAYRLYMGRSSRLVSPTDQDIALYWNSVIKRTFDSYIKEAIREVNIIPEFRQISLGEDYNFDGNNLIETLARFKDPPPGQDKDILKFQKIESFTKKLLHLNDSASISITRDNSIIMIQNEGLRLPLSHFGTGVHQIVILLTAILSKTGEVFCIEEPEIHLHPQLQREFINFLVENTENKYIITTHSPFLINLKFHSSISLSSQISSYFLNRENNSSFGKQIVNDSGTLQALSHIGVRASDLLQTNSVIWVEGPSDRVYIRHWLEIVNPNLKEGIDYQFIYYGGRVLAGFQAKRDSEEIDDLVNILKVNQNSIVVIDSDRKCEKDKINQTKARIRKECELIGLHCWVTYGREIENYIPENLIEETYSLLPGSLNFKRFDKIEDKLSSALKNSSKKSFDYSLRKTKHATEIIERFERRHMSDDLIKNISKIDKFIIESNSY